MAASLDNVCSALFQVYSSTNGPKLGIREFSDAMTGNQLLTSKTTSNIQELLGHVHGCLTMTKHRLGGLHLLKVIINQSSTEVFQQNAERWIRLLLQIIQGHSDEQVYRFSLQLLNEIFEFAKNFSEISRVIVTSTIPELVPVLLAPFSRHVIVDNIACINKCIQTYPGPMGPFKVKIETLIHKQLSNNARSKAVHHCFALLCQCGPGGSKGIKHTENWYKGCSELLGSLELTLDMLYDGFESDRNSNIEKQACLSLSEISRGGKASCHFVTLKSRWLTLCGCLEALLSGEMEATARIPVDRIVKLACRGMSVNSKMILYKPTSERMLLASCLTDIHQAVLCILEQFVVTCRKFLLPYASVITGLLSQELLWTKTKNNGHNMTFSLLREKVYRVMTMWLKVLDGCAGVSGEAKTWTEQILHDCSPYTESMRLNTTLSQSSNKSEDVSKKKKRKGYQEISQGISSQKKVHLDANSKLVQAGLDVLYWLITTSGSEMDRKPVQAIHAFTIKTLLSVQQSGEKQVPIPYSMSECRRALYRVLQACVINPHPHAPPPTQCAVRTFSQGQRDTSLEVSTLCIEATRMCELVLHPRAPILNGPVICDHVIKIGHEQHHIVDDNEGQREDKAGGKRIKDSNGNNTYSVINSYDITANTLKRSLDTSESSKKSKVIKLQENELDGDSVVIKNQPDCIESNQSDGADINDQSTIESDIESSENVGDNEDIDGELDDDVDEEVESDQGYTASKYVPETSMDLEKGDLLVDNAGDSGMEKSEMIGNIEDEMDNTENQSEEVDTMMLTFVDAAPDEA